MAQINRFSRRTPYEGSLYEMPIDLIARTLESTQKRYDQNKEIADTIQDFTIPSLAQDRERANALQRKYADEVDATVKEYSGNYAKASSKLKELTRKIKKDFNPGGEAAAISGNYTNYNTWLKDSQDLVEKGKVLGDDLNLANRYNMTNYKGIGEFDPVKGSYNVFNPETLSEYVDPDSIIQDAYKSFKPEKHKIGRTVFKDGLQVYEEQETEGITSARLDPSFSLALTSNPKYSSWLRQRLKYSGKDPNKATDYMQQYASQRAQDLSYMNSSDITKAERDPLFLLREKQRLKDASEAATQSGNVPFQWEPTSTVPYRKEAKIDPENWKTTAFGNEKIDAMKAGQDYANLTGNSIAGGLAFLGTKLLNTVMGSDYLSRGFVEAAGGPIGSAVAKHLRDARYDNLADKNLGQVKDDKKFLAKSNLDQGFINAIWDKKKQQYGTSFGTNYGKNPNWTDTFDKEVIREYTANQKNFSREQPIAITIDSPDARKDVLMSIAGRLADPGSVMVIPLGSSTPVSANMVNLTRSDLISDDGKLLTDDLQYVQPGPAYAGLGYQIHTKKGTFVIADQDINRHGFGQEMAGALNPLFFDGASISPQTMRIGTQMIRDPQTGQVYQQPARGFIQKSIEDDGNGGWAERLYAVAATNENGRLVPDYSRRIPTNMRELQTAYMPQFMTALGTGESLSSNSFHKFLNQFKER